MTGSFLVHGERHYELIGILENSIMAPPPRQEIVDFSSSVSALDHVLPPLQDGDYPHNLNQTADRI